MFFLKFDVNHLVGLPELCQDLCLIYSDIKKELASENQAQEVDNVNFNNSH